MVCKVKTHKPFALNFSRIANPTLHTLKNLLFGIFFPIYYQFNSIVFFHFVFPPKVRRLKVPQNKYYLDSPL